MPAIVHIDPIAEDVKLIVSDLLSPEAQGRQIAAVAREILAEAEQINLEAVGHIPPHDKFVDGRLGAAEETVRPNGGTIIYEFELLGEVFAWIGEMLVMHSPVLTGRYVESHKFFADGIELEMGSPVPPEAREFIFISDLPYARKIEKGLSPQAPDGVYQAVAVLASHRFHNIAQIRFRYQSPMGGGAALEAWASTTKRRRSRNIAADAAWNRRQPAIAITVLR